ncbi:MAG: hypothetical protein LBP87_02980 [Planctomycetaceae bacterium]|jgi:chromosome segregation ATPase|nr:hypothetical protein [Planctomycetaceae bacterium]
MPDNSVAYSKDFTPEQVWAMFMETSKKIQETSDNIEKLQAKYDAILEREAEERRKEAEERRKEAEERRKEDEKRRKEDEERRKEAEERRKEEAEERRKEDEERRKEDEERRKEDEERRKIIDEYARRRDEAVEQTTRSIADLGKRFGDLSNRFGELAEHLVAPGIADRFDELGYHFSIVAAKGVHFKENKRVIAEADILLENTNTIAIVEVKSKPTINDIEKHVERMEKIRRHLQQQPALSYKNDKELIGAVAGAIFLDEVKSFTIASGFYVITQSGDTVKIEIPEGFKPRIF